MQFWLTTKGSLCNRASFCSRHFDYKIGTRRLPFNFATGAKAVGNFWFKAGTIGKAFLEEKNFDFSK